MTGHFGGRTPSRSSALTASLPTPGVPTRRRLLQIQGASLLVLGLASLTSFHNRNLSALLDLGLATALLLAAMGLTLRGRLRAGTTVTLACLTGLVALIAFHQQGVRDPALLAFPGILVFAALLGSQALFTLLLGIVVAVCGALVVAARMGWHDPKPLPPGPGTFIDIAAILLGTGYAVWLLAKDLRTALARLAEENLRVSQSQGQIEFLAHYDLLTGLPNRTLARDRFREALARQREGRRGAALIHLDLDHFKTVNDSFGHAAGDRLLVEAATRIQAVLGPSDTLCRQAGDEFLVVLGDLASGDDAAEAAARIQAALAEPFRVQGLDVALTVSQGVALVPEDGSEFEHLLQRADTAMYQAKAGGGNLFRFFDPGMNKIMLEHLHLASALRGALERNELFLHFQPQFDLAEGRLAGAEALLRWRHPELGLVPPSSFIPVAEKSGLIGEVGRWVIMESCRQLRRFRDSGLRLVLAVNLSPIQFRRNDLEATLLTALEEAGVPASCLELELTESMLLEDTPALKTRLRNLRSMGLSFAIDDFGTGYSNLSYLQSFEVERLKIDQSFVRRLGQSAHDEAIVLAIVQMAKSLHLRTVAEGIEDPATLARLKVLGCDMGQGYLWSRPLPPDEFIAFCRAHRP